MPTQNNMEIQDHLGNVFNPKTVASQVKMEGNRDLSNYDVSTTQKGFMSAEDKVRLDKIYEQTNELYQDINSNQATETVTDSVAGTIQDIEILGNTYQNPSDLAEIKSVGKLREDGLYEVNVKSYGKNIFNEELFINALKQKNSSKVSIVTEEGKRCVKIIEAHLFKGFVLPFHFDKNKQYTFTFTNKHITQASFVIVVNYEDGTHSTFDTIKLGSFNKQTHISKPNSVIRSVEITFSQGGGTTFIDLDSFQIEENNVATPFEPYKETVATIKLPCQLEGIGDIKDRFYFDKEENAWCIEKKVIDFTWGIGNFNTWKSINGGQIHFKGDIPNFNDTKANNGVIYQICKEFLVDTYYNIATQPNYTKDKLGVGLSYHINNQYCINIATTKSLDEIRKMTLNFKAITKNPQKIILPLDTQIILNSFDGITHIELDGGEIQGTIKCKVSKSLKSSVNSLVEKTDNLDNRVKQIEGLKESQSLAYQSPKGSLVCTDTKNGVIEDLKISGRTLVNLVDTSSGRTYSTQAGGSITKIDNGFRVNFSSYRWAGGGIPIRHLEQGKTYTVLINVLKNTCTQSIDLTHYSDIGLGVNTRIDAGFTGTKIGKLTYTGTSGEQKFNLYVNKGGSSTSEYVEVQYLVIEGDYTNCPPEYFEGIKSVGQDINKIEILSNNSLINYLKDFKKLNNNDDLRVVGNAIEFKRTSTSTTVAGGVRYPIYLEKGKKYYVSAKSSSSSVFVAIYNYKENLDHRIDEVVPSINIEQKNISFTVNNSGMYYLAFGINQANISVTMEDIVVNSNGFDTGYITQKNTIKPLFYYDTNGDIVTIPELREWDTIEKHSDRKYYYHKVSGETTLTGDENWTVGLTGTPNFYYELPVTLTSKTGGDKVICNTLPYSGIGSSTTAMGISTTQGGRLRIRLNSEIPLADFKQWLKTNSTTVVFKAPQEEVYECVDLTLSSYEGMTNIQAISGAIKPSIEFKISSHINNVVLSNRDRINNIEKDFVDYVASQSAITLETRYMLDNMLPNNIDNYEENIDYNIYELLKKNIENDNVFIKKEKLMEMLDFYLNAKKITQEMYDELLGELTKDMIQTLETN